MIQFFALLVVFFRSIKLAPVFFGLFYLKNYVFWGFMFGNISPYETSCAKSQKIIVAENQVNIHGFFKTIFFEFLMENAWKLELKIENHGGFRNFF